MKKETKYLIMQGCLELLFKVLITDFSLYETLDLAPLLDLALVIYDSSDPASD